MSLANETNQDLIDAIRMDAKVGTPYDEREWGEYPVPLIEEALSRLAKQALVSGSKLADPAILDSGQKVKQLVEGLESDLRFLRGETIEGERHTFVPDAVIERLTRCHDALQSLATENASLKARLEESEERVRELDTLVDRFASHVAESDLDRPTDEFKRGYYGAVKRFRADRAALKGGTDV